jgi:hypothetical protein
MILGSYVDSWGGGRESERGKKKPMILEAMSNSTITYKFKAWHNLDSKNLK